MRLCAWIVMLVVIGVLQAEAACASKLVGVGDSIGAGVQSADASWRTQPYSYLSFLAVQMHTPLSLPLILSGPFGKVYDTSSRSRLFPFVSGSNLAVSGANVSSLLNDRADAANEGEIDSETDLILFPRLGSQMEITESIGAPFIVCWIGNNDILSAAISFDKLDASQLTSVERFSAGFSEIVQRFDVLGSKVVFANIPDISNIGFLLDRQDMIRFLGADFGLAEGDLTSIVVMLLIRLGLDDGSILLDPDFILDAGEAQLIRQRTGIFNQIIEDEATGIGMPVVDVNGLFDYLSANPAVFSDVPLTPRFLGGLFSLDGVHPSNIAHALLANAFIETINANFHTDIPPITGAALKLVFLTDPFVDKDGDGIVTGRFLAGLLETFGPAFGISGDIDDSVPDFFGAGINRDLGTEFKRQFEMLPGSGFLGDRNWSKAEVMEAFKHIFDLRVHGQ
ncbi:MAG: SGNH/GDSL hydrolase family protein [Thermodesulfobacteriota bacterium]|nr:SGNH/GDSL hydrolase family protein [Thermodesulfobacteriota bacterium]